jgi:hypothetical protein
MVKPNTIRKTRGKKAALAAKLLRKPFAGKSRNDLVNDHGPLSEAGVAGKLKNARINVHRLSPKGIATRKWRRELAKNYKPLPEDAAALLEKAERAAVAAAILKKIKKGRGKSKGRLELAEDYGRAMKEFHGKEAADRDARISQPTEDFESAAELASAVLGQCNLVEILTELVKDNGKRKNPTIRLRVIEELLERKYGKTAPAPREEEWAPPRIVLEGLPRPDRKPIKGEQS